MCGCVLRVNSFREGFHNQVGACIFSVPDFRKPDIYCLHTRTTCFIVGKGIESCYIRTDEWISYSYEGVFFLRVALFDV